MASPIIKELQVDETSAPMVVVLGQTGSGKSHFINKLAGKQVVKESPRLFSCTRRPELVEVKVMDHDFLMVDTPGFNDTWRDKTRSDGTILNEIARTLILQTQMGVKLRGILFFHDIRDPRMTGDKRRQIEMVKLICGKKNFSNVLLVTTNWPKSFQEQNDQGCALREADLRTEFWKDMIKEGSKMVRFDNEEDTAKTIVGSLARKPDIQLALQEEMASGKELHTTSAGSFVVSVRQDDELTLKKNLQVKTPKCADEEEEKEIMQMQASIRSRKEAEEKLKGNLVGDIRAQIRLIDDEARRRKRKPTVANVIHWLIGISELTAQIVQTAFEVT